MPNTIITSGGLNFVQRAALEGPYFPIKYFLPIYDHRIDPTVHTSPASSADSLSVIEVSASISEADVVPDGNVIFNTSASYSIPETDYLYIHDLNDYTSGSPSTLTGSPYNDTAFVNFRDGEPLNDVVSGTSIISTASGSWSITNAVTAGAASADYPTLSGSSSNFFPVNSYSPIVSADNDLVKGIWKCRLDNSIGSFKFNKVALYAVKMTSGGAEDVSQPPVLFAIMALPNPVIKQINGKNITNIELDVEIEYVTSGSNLSDVMFTTNDYWHKVPSENGLFWDGRVGLGTSGTEAWTPQAKMHISENDGSAQLRMDTDSTTGYVDYTLQTNGNLFIDVNNGAFTVESKSSGPAGWIGKNNTAASGASFAFALGDSNYNEGSWSFAFGDSCSAMGEHSHAYGFENITSGNNSFAFGSNCSACGDNATVDGYECYASGRFSHAYGVGASATGDGSWAINLDDLGNGFNVTSDSKFVIMNGQLGVDTTSPSSKIAVNGSGSSLWGIYSFVSAASETAIYGTNTGGGTGAFLQTTSGNALFAVASLNDGVAVRANATNGISLFAVGDAYFNDNIGIGTDNPISRISIGSSGLSSYTVYVAAQNNGYYSTVSAASSLAYNAIVNGTNSYGFFAVTDGEHSYGVFASSNKTSSVAIYGTNSTSWAGYFVGYGYFSRNVKIGGTPSIASGPQFNSSLSINSDGDSSYEVHIESAVNGISANGQIPIRCNATNTGIFVESDSFGIIAFGDTIAVLGTSQTKGVHGETTGTMSTNYGVYGKSGGGSSYALYGDGLSKVTGKLLVDDGVTLGSDGSENSNIKIATLQGTTTGTSTEYIAKPTYITEDNFLGLTCWLEDDVQDGTFWPQNSKTGASVNSYDIAVDFTNTDTIIILDRGSNIDSIGSKYRIVVTYSAD